LPLERLTRKEAKERTRQRLLDAVLELVRKEGLGGLTTGKVTEAAGIAQSSFYVHFTDMDDALEALARHLGDEIRAIVRAERQKIDLSVGNPEQALRGAYAASINAMLAEPAFTEILIGHRRDRMSPLGRCLRGVVDQARAELVSDLCAMGLADVQPSLEVVAELIVGMTLAIVEGIFDGRLPDRDAALDGLVRMTRTLAPGGPRAAQ
jgi:AcrR family transcriptional regulator